MSYFIQKIIDVSCNFLCYPQILLGFETDKPIISKLDIFLFFKLSHFNVTLSGHSGFPLTVPILKAMIILLSNVKYSFLCISHMYTLSDKATIL